MNSDPISGAIKDNNASMLESIGHEMKVSPPKILASTQRKFGPQRAEKQRVAILLSKARGVGAKIPPPKKSLGGF